MKNKEHNMMKRKTTMKMKKKSMMMRVTKRLTTTSCQLANLVITFKKATRANTLNQKISIKI